LKKSLKRPAMPPAPLQPRAWFYGVGGKKYQVVQARTKSEARARLKELFGLRRLPIGAAVLTAKQIAEPVGG
jgi:hypothetical protein